MTPLTSPRRDEDIDLLYEEYIENLVEQEYQRGLEQICATTHHQRDWTENDCICGMATYWPLTEQTIAQMEKDAEEWA